jgi:hypothetical protein
VIQYIRDHESDLIHNQRGVATDIKGILIRNKQLVAPDTAPEARAGPAPASVTPNHGAM